MTAPARVVCDIGNSRMKWGRLGDDGRIADRVALGLDDVPSWQAVIDGWRLDPGSDWVIASVNPPVTTRLQAFLDGRGMLHRRWSLGESDMPNRTTLPRPDLAGDDRALAVLAALNIGPRGSPGLVIQCGSAITVERISADGVWEGGAIGIGLGMSARALHEHTALLPEVLPAATPPPWGNATESALHAGLFWGTVGAVRELIARQDEPGSMPRWRVWTGGDADRIAAVVEDDPTANPIVPDLVLQGLAASAFGIRGEWDDA